MCVCFLTVTSSGLLLPFVSRLHANPMSADIQQINLPFRCGSVLLTYFNITIQHGLATYHRLFHVDLCENTSLYSQVGESSVITAKDLTSGKTSGEKEVVTYATNMCSSLVSCASCQIQTV